MAKTPGRPKKPGKSQRTKAGRPDVLPIGPVLAELLNPAINRGDAGTGSGTGLQPPPDNSWDRRAGGEAAAHRARASTRGKSEDVAKRDASSADVASDTAFPPRTPSSSSASDAAFPPPLRGPRRAKLALEVREGGDAETSLSGTPTPNLESELRSPRTPQGGGERNLQVARG